MTTTDDGNNGAITFEAIGGDGATGLGVWFAACVEHRGPDLDGPCEHCGWLAADHTAGLAEVIAVVPAAARPLRRAS